MLIFKAVFNTLYKVSRNTLCVSWSNFYNCCTNASRNVFGVPTQGLVHYSMLHAAYLATMLQD